MLVKIPKTGHFPWKAGCFFVLILIATAITYDAYKQGSFEATSIGTFMRDKGIIAGVQKTLVSIKLVLRKLPEYFETNYPEYYKTVVDFTTPYIKLLGDFYLVGKAVSIKLYGNLLSYGSTTIPIVGKRVEYYIPGLLDSVQQGFLKGIQIVKIYSVFIAEQTIEIYMKAARWLKTNVFIGKLSPDNLQNYANEAITRTHTFASQAYDWMYEKMETLSKVE